MLELLPLCRSAVQPTSDDALCNCGATTYPKAREPPSCRNFAENAVLSQRWRVQAQAAHGFVLNREGDAAIKMAMKRAVLMWASVASGACVFAALAGNAVAGPHDALITKHA